MKAVTHVMTGLLAIALVFPLQPACGQKSEQAVRTVVIDPGHGGKDSGAQGRRSQEKNIVLSVALKLGKMIKEAYRDVKVIYTRDKDEFIELATRGDIANKAHANLFISIHANSIPLDKRRDFGAKTYGAETFVMGNSKSDENMEVAKLENSVVMIEDDYSERYEGFDNSPESYIMFSLLQNAYINQSLNFAAEVQDQFKAADRFDRGVKQANFLVLWKTTMPSVLIELGFISNADEEKYMNSSKGKEELARSIFNAFVSYKTKVDARSKREPVAQKNTAAKPKSTAAPKQTADKSDKPAAPEPAETSKVEFCVQIASSSKPIDTDPRNFKRQKGVQRIKVSSSLYKYIIGRTDSYSDVQDSLKTVGNDFKDAFIVGLISGKIVPVSEALKEIGN